MKKISMMAVGLAAMLAVSMAACSTADSNKENMAIGADSSQSAASENTQIPNPWQEISSMQDAQNLAGFTLTGPETLHEMPMDFMQILPDEKEPVVEIRYDGKDDEYASIRKSTSKGDISGVYTQYADSKELLVGENTVLAKGNGDAYELANWSKGEYSYSLFVSGGVSQDELLQIVAEVE